MALKFPIFKIRQLYGVKILPIYNDFIYRQEIQFIFCPNFPPMMQRNNIFQMQNYTSTTAQENLQLDKIPENVLPNVMNLLGQFSRNNQRNKLPRYSAFYISPLSNLSLVYNLLYMFAFYLIQIQIPLILAFGTNFLQSQFSNFGYNFCYWLIFGFFIFDILVSFHKGYHEYGKGKVCDDQTKIVEHYFKTQIYFDVTVIGFLIVPTANQNQDVDLLLLISLILMWIKKYKYQLQIIHILQYKRTLRTLFMLTVLFIDVLLLGHFGACLYIGMDIAMWNSQYYGSNTNYYWLSNNNNYAVNLMNGDWYDQYVYAQSFSTGTLSTLAPGPFAKNPIEVSFALFVMIYFMLLASYIGQVLISILYIQEIKRVFHEQNIQDFDKYMTLKNISESLTTRIYNFFQLIWDAQTRMQSEQQKICINLLPLNLKEQLLLQMSFVRSFFMFKYIDDSKTFEKQLALRINRIIVDSETCLFRQANLIQKKNEQSALYLNSIYFLSRGMVKYYITLNKQKHIFGQKSHTSYFDIKHNSQGIQNSQNNEPAKKNQQYIISMSNSDKFIGLYQFVTKKAFYYCCKAIDLCELDAIPRKDFIDILRLTKNQQVYHRLRHQILVQNNILIINKICSICFQNHIEQKCPAINYHQRIVTQFMWTENNIGKSHPRNSNFNRDRNKKLTSRKVLNKQKLKLQNKKREALQSFSIFSQILQSSNIKLQELLFNIAKMDDIEQAYVWEEYYPEDNVDRVSFILYQRARGKK